MRLLPLAVFGFLTITSPVHATGLQIFSDVPHTHPNAEAITYLRTNRFVNGYKDGSYRPDSTITRAEFVKILVEVLFDSVEERALVEGCRQAVAGAPREVFVELTDADYGAWYGKYLCMAQRSSMVYGYEGRVFRPSQPINVVEAAKIVVNGFGIAEDPYEDIRHGTKLWYKPFIDALAKRNALPISIKAFDQKLTRGEMAEIVHRLHAGILTKPSRTFSQIQSGRGNTGFYENKDIPLSFAFPPAWGDVTKNTNLYRTNYAYALTFTSLDPEHQAPLSRTTTVEIDLLAYDSGARRYEVTCEGEGCEPVQRDLLEEKEQIKEQAATTIDGFPTIVKDFYYPPAGNLSREYRFFTDKYRFSIYANYDVDPAVFYPGSPRQQSILDLVREDIGEELSDPIEKMIQKHPEVPELKSFYDDVKSMMESMKLK